jgi:hypothetical protein
MNGNSRREYLAVIHSRYRQAKQHEKKVILNEFYRNTRGITAGSPCVF